MATKQALGRSVGSSAAQSAQPIAKTAVTCGDCMHVAAAQTCECITSAAAYMRRSACPACASTASGARSECSSRTHAIARQEGGAALTRARRRERTASTHSTSSQPPKQTAVTPAARPNLQVM